MIKVLITAIIVAMSMLFVQVYFTTEAKKETAIQKSYSDSLQLSLDSLYYTFDSLKNEAFILETNLKRYEIAAEMLEQEDQNAASKFYQKLSMTE